MKRNLTVNEWEFLVMLFFVTIALVVTFLCHKYDNCMAVVGDKSFCLFNLL